MAKLILGNACAAAEENADVEGLLSCLQAGGVTNVTPISSPDFNPLLDFSAQNLRFTEPQIRRPCVIILPENEMELQQSVQCSIKHGWEIRVRSGGHSYEGLSYTASAPFVLIDLQKLNKVTVDAKSKTAWVEAGATLGEIYSAVANSSAELGFPAGICHTVGCGGHFAGGGLGLLTRKYGLASDNVLDARLINASGEIMDKNIMGEDVFWALRGGGGGNWGVVCAWNIQLVSLPPVLTAFKVLKIGADIVTDTVHKWQYVAPQAEEDLFIRVEIRVEKDTKDIKALFHGIYLGRKNELLSKIAKIFPELRMEAAHCEEMSWIQTVCYFDEIKCSELTNRCTRKEYFKIKSDFAKVPLPEPALRGLWTIMEKEANAYVAFSPLGGMMDTIPSSATPFPQRAGTLFDIHYNITWTESSRDHYYLEWMRTLYQYMEPYVSCSPRAAYVNFLDLDLGSSPDGHASVEEARVWGEKYFDANFERLVEAKTQVDRHNHFRNPQVIPPHPN